MKNKKKKSKKKNKKIKNKYKTHKALIAYFDILGYKEIVKSKDTSQELLIEIINDITETVYDTKVFTQKGYSKWNVYSFSDNYAIVVNYLEEGLVIELENLIYILRTIQCEFISLYSIIIRGSITHGMIYLGDKFIYGEGLIRAYEIENSIAIYPRIIVDADLINECLMYVKNYSKKSVTLNGVTYNPNDINEFNMFKMFSRFYMFDSDEADKKEVDDFLKDRKDEDLITLCQDFDNEYYIDFFQHYIYLKRNAKDVEYFINRFKITIYRHIFKYGEDNKILKKYLWVCNKANIFFNKLGYINMFNKLEIKNKCKLDLDNVRTDDDVLLTFINDLSVQ